MAALTTNTVPNAGLRLDTLLTAVNASDDCEAGAGIYLYVRNANAGTLTVTIVTPGVIDGDLAIADRAVTLVASVEYKIIPIHATYRDPATGRATIQYSPTASVTACVIKTAVQ